MAHPLEQGGSQHGRDMARQLEESSGALSLPLSNPRVQAFLAKLAFPGDTIDAGMKWAVESDLSSRFRAYKDDPARSPEELAIDIKDTEALTQLLSAVQAHTPEETIH